MKKVFSILVVMAFVFAGVAQSGDTQAQPKKNKKVKTPEITFVKLVHDYGQIEQGANGECEFEFKNTGKADLILTKGGKTIAVRVLCLRHLLHFVKQFQVII